MLLVFVTSSFVLFPFQTHVAQARSTYVSEVYGEVFILRNKQLIKGKAFQDLREGDTILTKGKSFVTIHFLDDSLSRLGENTQLQIQKLSIEPLNPVATRVGLFLKDGRVWSRVVNLVDDHSDFTVSTKQAKAKVAKKAAFDLLVQNDQMRLSVFDNVVDLVPVDNHETDNQKETQSVVAGYAAAISVDRKIQLVSFDTADSSQKPYPLWVESNLNRDQAYDQHLINEKEKFIDSDDEKSESNFLQSDEVRDAIFLTNPDLQKAAEAFMDAYREFKRGETMLVRGFHKEGLESLKNFQRQATEIIRQFPELEQRDPFSSDVLRQMMDEKIALQLKDLTAFLPGDRLYPAKEVLQQVQQLLPSDDMSKTQLRLSQSESKLLEIQELIKDEKIDLAVTLLKEYERQTAQLVVKVDKQNIHEFEDKLVHMVSQQVQQIKALTAIEQNVKYAPPTDEHTSKLLERVQKIRRESLKQLVMSIDQLPEGLSTQLIADLKNIFDTYLAASKEDEDLIVPAFNKLVAKDYQLSFIQPDDARIPVKLGAVTIIPQEATADASENVTRESEESL